VSELGQPFNDTTALDSIGRSSHAPEREVDAPAASVVTSPGLLAILAHNLVEARIIYRGEHGAGGAYLHSNLDKTWTIALSLPVGKARTDLELIHQMRN
jgi:hypothetical protein